MLPLPGPPSVPLRLACSGFEHAYVVLGGESYIALAEEVQKRAVGAGRRNARAPQRQPVGVPQPGSRSARRSDPALRLTLCTHTARSPRAITAGLPTRTAPLRVRTVIRRSAVRTALLLRGSASLISWLIVASSTRSSGLITLATPSASRPSLPSCRRLRLTASATTSRRACTSPPRRSNKRCSAAHHGAPSVDLFIATSFAGPPRVLSSI